MNHKLLKISIFTLLIIFYGSFLFVKITLPSALDLPRQMQNGNDILQGNFDVITKNVYSYIEPNQPFANHHWLSGVFFYILYTLVGWNGMVLFKVVFILLTFVLLFWVIIRKNDFWVALLFSIPAVLILVSRTALRPEIFSYLFVVLFLYLLIDFQYNPHKNRIFWLTPLQILWVNTHLFFGIGVFMVAGFLLEMVILNFRNFKKSLVIRKTSIVLIMLMGVIFLNPFGLKGAVYSFWVNSYKDFPIHSAEIILISDVLKSESGWRSISASVFWPVTFLLAASFIVALVFRWKRKPNGFTENWKLLFSNNFIFYFLASVGSGALGYYVTRGLPLYGLIFLPAVVNNLNEPFISLKELMQKKWPKLIKPIGVFCIIILALILIWLTILCQKRIMSSNEQGLGLARHSKSSIEFFKDQEIKGPIFNDTDIGSYLIGELYPQERVFSDNRFGDAYSGSFFADIYLPMLQSDIKWQEGMEKYNFNVIFFYHYDQVEGARDFLYRRVYDAQWSWVYVDNYAIILVKRKPENQYIIDKFEITGDNVVDKLRYLSESKYPEEQLVAADILNLIGRIDSSLPIYLKFVSQWPSRGKVWMVLGRTELTKANLEDSNPYIAAVFLERAIAEGWKTWESYSYLALAYYRTGQIDRAKEAVYQELKIDPDSKDGRQWLDFFAKEESK